MDTHSGGVAASVGIVVDEVEDDGLSIASGRDGGGEKFPSPH